MGAGLWNRCVATLSWWQELRQGLIGMKWCGPLELEVKDGIVLVENSHNFFFNIMERLTFSLTSL